MPEERGDKSRKHIIRRLCRVRMEMVVRCETRSLREITVNMTEIKGGLLDINRKGVQVHTREPFPENQELRIALGFPDGAKIQAKALACSSKFLPKHELYVSEILFLDMSPQDRASLDTFLSSLPE